VVGDAVMGSYDGQRAAAHVRAFAAKAEWALGMIIFRVVLPAVVSNSSTRFDDIAPVVVRLASVPLLVGRQKLTPGTSVPISAAKPRIVFTLLPYAFITVLPWIRLDIHGRIVVLPHNLI
jgi:hypothetical protein